MLIKKSIVERWYQRDSWVFKQFSYLFQNPLWHKNVPCGFSVCPYFWLSLFSLFIFRPLFVFPINYLFRPLVVGIGKPAKAIDKGMLRFVNWVGITIDDIECRPTGAGLLVAVVLLAFATAAGFFGVKLWIATATAYANFQEGHNILGMFAIWSAYSFAGLFAVIGGHKLITKTDCKTLNYLWIWVVLFTIASFVFIPSEIGHGLSLLGSTISTVIAITGVFIWKLVLGLVSGIAVGGGYIWKGTKFLFAWTPWKMVILPWWAYIAALSLAAYFTDRMGKKLDELEYKKTVEDKTGQFEQRFRESWLLLFRRALWLDEDYRKNRMLELALEGVCSKHEKKFESVKLFKLWIFEKAFDLMWKEKLDLLQKNYPPLHLISWRETEKETSGDLSRVFCKLEKILNVQLGWSDYVFNSFIVKAYQDPQIQQAIADNLALREERERVKGARHQAWINGWTHQTCLKVTDWIGNTVSNIWAGLTAIGRGIKLVFVNIGTFFAYIWMLLKSKKQGACPFFIFTDKP
jgi:hypothetical protein